MQATGDRDQFAPPRPPGRSRAVSLAVLAHLALIGALTWGVRWKASDDAPAVEAELWSAVPQQAAPRAVAPPPPPPAPAPAPRPAPVPAPAPPPPAPPPPKVAEPREADIALEREKKRVEEEKKRQQQIAEREKRERERKEEERRERLEQEKKERAAQQKAEQKAEREKAEKEKAEREKAEREKAEREKAEQDKKKKAAEDKRRAEADDKRAEELRKEQLRRIAGLAGATGAETATGTAQRSSGPSGSYGGKVAAKVRPNIVYPDAVAGNPRAEVEVRAAPDGTIVGVRVVQSSGNKSWDEAVVRALHKTETLPRDVDGRVPPSLVIGFRPKD
ncbi:cell envelope integrity protein TolA [Pulveribacter suum]|uniref:Cell envelope integrity protein TolA n=1 Tax=Pulveribacter suum TaxID=2116657 RepID=A0A2P1NPN2_9BURK|nr:cell envelope integrity protein TolA [Pulveribacter suum]AVP59022.1 cell envelope integrity protein TolA [Pulveribacter suum]